MLNVSLRLLKETGLPLKNGLNNEPIRTAGTRNRIAKSQYPLPTRQINTRLSINFNPAFPSNIAVMITPAIEAERTEDNAKPWGINPRITRYIVPDPSTNVKMKNDPIGYLCNKLKRSVFSFNIISWFATSRCWAALPKVEPHILTQ